MLWKSVLIGASLFASTSASAADWQQAGRSAKGTNHYIDVSSIVRNGSLRTFWVKAVYNAPNQYGDDEAVSREAIYCAGKRIRLMQWATFRAGASTGSGRPDEPWKDIMPESVAEARFKLVCSR